MNERIEELGEQADLLGEFTPTKIPGRYVGYITEEQIQKFAKLIVRECMDIAYAYDAPKLSGPGMIVANRIEDHFGVEE